MSTNGGGGRAAGSAGAGAGAGATAKMLQSIKEIVGGNFPEDEIRAMLKECNMDPGETVHRLLNQDTFHEVKSKREKKKETNGESRSRGVNNSSNRGGRGIADYSGRIGSTQVSSSEYAGNHSKPMQKKENGPNSIPISPVLGFGVGESGITKSSTPSSNSIVMENTGHLTATADAISSQYLEGIASAWSGVPGQRTLADIVKMGRPPSKTSRVPVAQTESWTGHNITTSRDPPARADGSMSMVLPSDSHNEDPISSVSEIDHEPGTSVGQDTSHDEWPLVAQGGPLSEAHDISAVFNDQSTSSNLLADGVRLCGNSGLEVHVIEENVDVNNPAEDSVGPVAASDRHTQVFTQVNTPVEEPVNDVHVDVSSAVASLQQLSLHKEASVAQADDNPSVIFPNNLQITNSDCSHLSFGSFGAGLSASFSGSFASNTQQCNLEVPSETTDATSMDHSDVRNLEYYGNEQLSSKDENADPRPSTNAESYERPSSHPDAIRADSSDATEGLQYRIQSSVSDYPFSSATQPNAASYASVQEDSQMQARAPFSGIMQAYTSSSPSNLLASTMQPAREFDLPYSNLLATQSMPTKYSTSVSSASGPSISMLEVLKPGVFSTAQPTQQNLPTTVPTGPAVPQHLPVHSYSQPTLPPGHFANMIGYPFLPHNYAYMPSAAFPQAYSSNSIYNQSPAAVNASIKYTLPQFKTNVAISNLPQTAAASSGFGGFGSSANILGNFALNPSTSSTSMTLGYDGISSSQYKDGNPYVRPQQGESSAIWLQEGGSRTMSSLAARTYYSLQGQNQHSGFRQSQQSPYGTVGYPNLYHSQAGASQEHQQNSGDGSLNAARGPASQMASQLWQRNY